LKSTERIRKEMFSSDMEEVSKILETVVVKQSNQQEFFHLFLCCHPHLVWRAVAVIAVRVVTYANSFTVWYNSFSVRNSYKFVHSFFRVLKYLFIGALSYGYPALLMLCVTWTDSQNSTNALDVYWEP